MFDRNPKSKWNPAYSVDITPVEYEKQVVEWLNRSKGTLEDFEVVHLQHLAGHGGDFEFDAVARFKLFQGAQIIILVECKRYSQPVERDKILSLWAKLQDVKAHKAMMFATCGFQSGALEYAKSYNIAAIAFVEGKFLYHAKSMCSTSDPPSWANIPKYSGIFLLQEKNTVHCTTINQENVEVLSEWIKS